MARESLALVGRGIRSYVSPILRVNESDIYWYQGEIPCGIDNLPDSAVLAREIVESLETALEQFRGIEDELKQDK